MAQDFVEAGQIVDGVLEHILAIKLLVYVVFFDCHSNVVATLLCWLRCLLRVGQNRLLEANAEEVKQ